MTYTPQLNKMAEQMNKTFTERIRVIPRIASLSNLFWVEAPKIACYVVNQSPSTTINLKTSTKM